MKKLSILILTHKRPNLFKRCIEAILPQIDDTIEIIVNNDSCDIDEIIHPSISYHYGVFDNISLIYEFLLNEAIGEYVYFAEDDDYVVDDFTSICLHGDLIVGNYCPTYETEQKLVCMSSMKDSKIPSSLFVNSLDFYNLQLSQFIFKRSIISSFVFPMDNNVYNDINLVLYAAEKSNDIYSIRKIIYYQTIDGGDNISFPESKTNLKLDRSLIFLNDYKTLNITDKEKKSLLEDLSGIEK